MQNALSIMIKPASSLCNLNCKYCFYKDVSRNREVYSHDLMTKATYRNIIDKAFLTKANHVTFNFQGGEPTLAGLDFFKGFVTYVNKVKINQTITYGIQTNAYTLNKQWASFFKDNNFLVGVSVDGIESVHNQLRPIQGQETFAKIMENIKLLKDYQVDFNILIVLSKQLRSYGSEVFKNLLRWEVDFVQVIECLPEINETVYESEYACTPEVYKEFYTDFYQAWLETLRAKKYFSVNTIDDAVRMLSNQMPASCGRNGRCNLQYIFEADGSMYPCDFYVLDEYKLGNINNNSLSELANHSNAIKFINEKRHLKDICQSCDYRYICNTGCKRMTNNFVLDNLCGFKDLLDLARNDLEEIFTLLQTISLNQ